MKSILIIFSSLLAGSISSVFAATNEPNLYAKCNITISKMGSPDKQACQSLPLPKKCISETPGEPEMCSPTGKLSVQSETVSISAEFINFTLALWVNSGDKNWMVAKVDSAALQFPRSFNILIPVRNSDQVATGEKAFINCTLISANDDARNCP